MTAIRMLGKDVKLVYVKLTGKIKESRAELASRLPDLVEIRADQRLKPENQPADLAKKIDKFVDEIGDKYFLVNPQITFSVNGKEVTCFASEFDQKVNKAIGETLGHSILLFGKDVDIVYRAVMRQILLSGIAPTKPISFVDVLARVISSSDWEKMTPAARKEMYYPATEEEVFYSMLFDTTYGADGIILGD